MLSNRAYGTLLAVSLLVALLSVVNVALSRMVASTRVEVARGNAQLQQAGQVGAVYKQLVAALAETSTQLGDTQLKEVLTRNGLTLTVNADAAAQSASANRVQPQKTAK